MVIPIARRAVGAAWPTRVMEPKEDVKAQVVSRNQSSQPPQQIRLQVDQAETKTRLQEGYLQHYLLNTQAFDQMQSDGSTDFRRMDPKELHAQHRLARDVRSRRRLNRKSVLRKLPKQSRKTSR